MLSLTIILTFCVFVKLNIPLDSFKFHAECTIYSKQCCQKLTDKPSEKHVTETLKEDYWYRPQ